MRSPDCAHIFANVVTGRSETGGAAASEGEPAGYRQEHMSWNVAVRDDSDFRRRKELRTRTGHSFPIHRQTKRVDCVGADPIGISPIVGLREGFKTPTRRAQQVVGCGWV